MIFGTGGVGGYFGAKLARAGFDVKFVARGQHLAALREQGLTVESQLGNFHLPKIKVSDTPSELGSADYILICVKLWDTESVAREIRPLVGPETTVVSLQNGVRKDDVLRSLLGDRPVVGGISLVSAKILCPGVIRHTGSMQKLIFGEYDSSLSHRLKILVNACRQSNFDAEITTDIRRSIWEKFVFLVGLSATTTATRKSIGEIRSNDKTRALLLDIMRETAAVGRRQGIEFDKNFVEERLAVFDTLPFEVTSSMHHDLEKGNPLEVAWLSGEVARLGAICGIETPLNRAISDILELHTQGDGHFL
jgi:2-dehydropantoate 2-reductase